MDLNLNFGSPVLPKVLTSETKQNKKQARRHRLLPVTDFLPPSSSVSSAPSVWNEHPVHKRFRPITLCVYQGVVSISSLHAPKTTRHRSNENLSVPETKQASAVSVGLCIVNLVKKRCVVSSVRILKQVESTSSGSHGIQSTEY